MTAHWSKKLDPNWSIKDMMKTNKSIPSLDLCDVNFTYGNHSINQDSAHWPMGIKMLRPISGYLERELNRDVMRN